MASGIDPTSECFTVFTDLKIKKNLKFIIYRINDTFDKIIVDKTSSSSNYDDFINALPETECRYAVYDFEFDSEEGGKRNKLVFISWSPADSSVKQRMVSASSKDALRRGLVGIATEVQGTDSSEIAHASIIEKLVRRR